MILKDLICGRELQLPRGSAGGLGSRELELPPTSAEKFSHPRKNEVKRLIMLMGVSLGAVCGLAADWRDSGGVFPLDNFLARGDLWGMTTNDLVPALRPGRFTWLDEEKTTALGGKWMRLSFLNFPVWEAQVRLESNRVNRVELSFYNRGDAGDLSAGDFEKLLNRVIWALTNWTASAGTALPDLAGAAHTKVQRAMWLRPPSRLELEWSTSKPHLEGGKQTLYRSEFIRLKVLPVTAPTNVAPPKLVTWQTVFALRKRVQSLDDGDTFIAGVPMVDQGFKGYCAAAVIARLMRYYGKDFDQHDAAQLAGTTAQEGTRNLSMKDALKKLAQQNGLHFQAAQEADIQRLVTDYNLAATLARKPKVQLAHNLDTMLLGMDRELLLKIRGRNQAAATVFKDLVSKSIANGLPVVWHVYLGLFAEPGMWPMQGAHARLIIGYNKKSGDILYTDTWGRGHELKRMNVEEAVAITLGLYVIKPPNA